MSKRIAINGFGRIGRLTLRNLLSNPDVEIVAINDLTDNATLAHLLKYDSVHGQLNKKISYTDDSIIIDGKSINAYAEKNPAELPWKKLKVDVVLECTGRFRTREQAQMHLNAGARKVIISAPAKSADVPTIVLGVNEQELSLEDTIISNASCTTNCLAPVVKIIEDNWGLVQGFMTTTHAYTSDQKLQDSPHSDLRRARAATQNIVPTSTGAADALGLVLPKAKGKISAMALRVPVICGSLVELTCLVENVPTREAVNNVFQSAASDSMKGILEYSEAPLVSSDIIGNKYSSIFDAPLTKVVGQMLHVVAWYDNEAGYSARLAELASHVATKSNVLV